MLRYPLLFPLFVTLLYAGSLMGQIPSAAFVADTTTGCEPFPLVVNFQDQSTGSPTSWLWSFGDLNGSTSTLQNPSFVYTSPGCYTVVLIVNNASGSDTLIQPCFIEIFEQPDPGFMVDVSEGCAPLTVTFTDTSIANAAGIVNWVWTLTSNNVPLSGQNPTHTFPTTDTTGVILTVTNTNGCENTILVPNVVMVLEPPVADFSVDVNAACVPPLTVNFSNLTQTNGASNPNYTWNFPGGSLPGGGSTFMGQTPPPVTYNANGQYDVELIVQSANNCADTLLISNMIGIGGVVADFTVSDTVVCLGEPVSFTNASTGGAVSFGWNVDNVAGYESTSANFSFTYPAVGTYTVVLEAENPQCGDTVTVVDLIEVLPVPTADFMVDKLVDCQPGNPFTFTDLSTNAVSWAWDFDGTGTSAQQNPVHTFPNFGSYNVCLTVTNVEGCTATFCETITIAPATADFTYQPNEGCAPLSVSLTDQSNTSGDPIVMWEWDFGSPTAMPPTSLVQNPSVTYPNQGIYDIKLTITTAGGCVDSLTINNAVEVGLPATIDFIADKDTVCINEDITFTSLFTDPQWDYFWDFQYEAPGAFAPMDEMPTTTYSDTGWFNVALYIYNMGCRDTLVIDSMVYVNPPDAIFFPDNFLFCDLPGVVSFADSSIGPVDVYEWSINGMPYSNMPTPPDLNITTIGSYFVKLVVRDTMAGCVDSSEVVINAGDPMADFTVTDTFGCKPFTTDFINNSTNAFSYSWKFKVGLTGGITTAEDPTYTYTDTGTYTIRLVAFDLFGCSDTLIKPLHVNVVGPYPDFTAVPDEGCPPLLVQFMDNTATTALSSPTAWSWDFGDMTGGAGVMNPSHTYFNVGTYDVTLTVTDTEGCVDSVTVPNAVTLTLPTPDFIVNDDSTCAGNDLTFTSTSTGKAPLSFFWDFGDGNTSTGSVATHAYQDTGSYDVQLIVTDGNGCVDSVTFTDFIYIEPFQAGFFGDPTIGICPPLTSAFTDTTIGNVIGWDWDFGTGLNFSSLQNPQNVYFTPGNFTVTLIATHEDGCRDTTVAVDYIQLNGPFGSFVISPPNACLGDTVCAEAEVYGTDLMIVDWKSGSPSFVTGLTGVADTLSVCFVYGADGKYFPEVVLQDNQGCSATLSSPDSVQIYRLPQAQIAPVDTTGCLPFSVPFLDASIPGDTNIISWNWDLGDMTTSTMQNPTNIYMLDSMYTISLLVEDENGCRDSISTTVTAYEGTIGDFAATDTGGCAPFTTMFSDGSSNLPATGWTWIFGDGDTLTGVANPTHTYQNNGIYTVTLIVEDGLGCTDTVVKTDYIVLRHPTSRVYANSVFGCNPVNLTFFADSSSHDSLRTLIDYEWCLVNRNTGAVNCMNTSAGVDSLTWQFNDGGDFAMLLTITDSEGCTDVSDSLFVTINTRVIPDPITVRNVSVLGQHSAEVSWLPYQGTDFVEYAIWRVGPNLPKLVGTVTDQLTLSFVDNDPTMNLERNAFCYKVLVQNVCLEYSLMEDTDEHCTVELEVARGIDALDLSWTAYVGYQPLSYEIYRANTYDTASAMQIGIVPGNVLEYTDLETFCEDSISYRVVAVGQGLDQRSWSDVDANRPFHPEPTEMTHIRAASVLNDTFVEVSWSPYGGYRPDYYYLEKSSDDGFSWDSLISVPLTENSYVDEDVLVDEQSYLYRVFTVDQCEDRSVEGRLGKTIKLNVHLDPTGRIPILDWSDYEEWLNGVRNYDIEIFNTQTGLYEVVTQLTNNRNHFEDEQTQLFQTTYCYRIHAYEAGNLGAEAFSNEDCVTFGPIIYVPNAFTPNGDGNNEEFRVFVPNLRVGEIAIYNRWGEQLYRSLDLSQGWDGTFNGREVPEGVYVFVIKGVGEDDTEFVRQGTVTLFR